MSYRSFSPFPVLSQDFSRSSSCCPTIDSSLLYEFPHPDTPFSNLQSFCNMARDAAVASPSIDSSFHLEYDNYSTISQQLSCNGWDAGLNQPLNSQSQYPEDSDQFLEEGELEDDAGVDMQDEDDDDEGADWFDLEALGLLGLELNPDGRFEFPVPSYPIIPTEELLIGSFSGQHFYMDEQGYVQVFTEGECYKAFVEKPSIGVWFGPNHELNVSERVHRGRRTQEAAKFAAVIEAIKVAGSYGVTKLQVNTGYINIVQFMMYFILKWENNNWMTIRNTPVRNQVLIRELDYFSRLIDIKWNYVQPYDEVEGLIEAQRLAEEALHLKLPPSDTSREPNVKTPVPSDFDAVESAPSPPLHN